MLKIGTIKSEPLPGRVYLYLHGTTKFNFEKFNDFCLYFFSWTITFCQKIAKIFQKSRKPVFRIFCKNVLAMRFIFSILKNHYEKLPKWSKWRESYGNLEKFNSQLIYFLIIWKLCHSKKMERLSPRKVILNETTRSYLIKWLSFKYLEMFNFIFTILYKFGQKLKPKI